MQINLLFWEFNIKKENRIYYHKNFHGLYFDISEYLIRQLCNMYSFF